MVENKLSPTITYFKFMGLEGEGIFPTLLTQHHKGNYLPTVLIKELGLEREFYISQDRAFDLASQHVYSTILNF